MKARLKLATARLGGRDGQGHPPKHAHEASRVQVGPNSVNALPETAFMPSAKCFAECRTWQTMTLGKERFAKCRALGK
jgi:hypothetical protein